jgi:hypothetical protein
MVRTKTDKVSMHTGNTVKSAPHTDFFVSLTKENKHISFAVFFIFKYERTYDPHQAFIYRKT